jgi:uncharacterized protein (TIGR02453 family)
MSGPSPEPARFTGWPAEALDFFDGLEADNSKAYWQEHRATYEAAVKAPMDALLAELAAEFGPARTFRPYRDVRFSADKTPYKTNIAASLASGGYLELSASGLGAGRGSWHLATDQLARFRDAVADDASGGELEETLKALQHKGIEAIAMDSLKTAPRGYPKAHPRIELLRRKGLAAWRQWPVAPWLGTAKAKDRVVTFLRDAAPVADWLDAHVGPSTLTYD